MSELFAPEALPVAPVTSGATVLARKYRPSTFGELIGQEAMVKTLTNAIAVNRLPHAWMLTGVRGIGKTTTARIIARALNCTGVDGKSGPTIMPCGLCDACRAIAEDRHVDVMEMDAASRTSVDDIREIIDGVRYGPVSGRFKIYILDEVHMLSKNAFNALLKTLEEPPAHTKFIFATTEIRKVPVTVLSRCQRFDLKRIDSAQLHTHFMNILAKEKIEAEDEGIKLIAHAADGSVRDGLSLLDQAIARAGGKILSADVKDMLGLADRSQTLSLARHLLRGEMKDALQSYTGLIQSGADPIQILQDMADIVHLLTRAQIITDLAHAPDMPEMDKGLLTDLADVKVSALTRAWQILLKGVGEVQVAPHPAQAAEMVLIRLAYAAELPTPGDLIKKLQDKFGADAKGETGDGGSSGPAPRGMRQGNSVAMRQGNSVAVMKPVLAPMAIPSGERNPQNFLEVVGLFEEHREGALVAELRGNVHLVRCVEGALEVRLEPTASPDLVNRLMMNLSRWTGQRWMVSVSSEEGETTLFDQDKERERVRMERIHAHPLMQAALGLFDKARIVEVRQKVALQVVEAQNDAPDEGPDSLPTDSYDLED